MKKIFVRAFCGFVAAALSVLIFHQLTVFVLVQLGLLQTEVWSLTPTGPFAIPRLLNQIFWGGLWGIAYALLGFAVFRGPRWLIGAIFGLFVVVLGNFLIVPLIKGLPLFAGLDVKLILSLLLIHIHFGIGIAVIYQKLEPWHSPPFKVVSI